MSTSSITMPASHHPTNMDSRTDALLKILLKAVGLKVTASRLVVLAYFYQQFQAGESTPISHAELIDLLHDSISGASSLSFAVLKFLCTSVYTSNSPFLIPRICTHLSNHARGLMERLPQQGLDKVTIYRNLNDLAQTNLLLKHSLGDTLWRYSYHHVFCASLLPSVEKNSSTKANQAHHLHAHPHFVCSQCSQLTCLPFENKEIPTAWAFQIGLIEEITVRGLCQSCHHQRR